jgi:putative Holliday junction resolvase
MPILGLDLGEKRVGVAVSDAIGMMAHPVTTLEVTGEKSLVQQVGKVAAEREATMLVVGLPLNQDGTKGPRALRVESLADALHRGTGLPVELVDERFSSQAAQRAIAEAPRKVKRDKGTLDKLAAVYILQAYLDRK